MRVALVKPYLPGHKNRGTGNYTKHLYNHLQLFNKELDIQYIDSPPKKGQFDIVHYPFFDPFFLTLPIFKDNKTIVTVHDLIPIQFPQLFPKGLKGSIKWFLQKESLKNVQSVITDSNSSQKAIHSILKIPEKKIHTIYLAADEIFKPLVKEKRGLQIKKLEIPQQYILHVGDVNYNKNILRFLKSFLIVSQKHKNLSVVLVGNGFISPTIQLEEILQFIKENKLEEKVVRIGHISDDELVDLYNNALVYVQPSIAEGFGLPILEAMACGCPVATSNTTSLVEIASDAALFFDPYDSNEIEDVLTRFIENIKLRKIYIQKGLKNVQRFSWMKCARETLAVYQNVHEQNNSKT